MTYADEMVDIYDRIVDHFPDRALLESGPADPPHWACPDCGAPCYCVDPLVRSLPHRPCSVPEQVAA